MNLLAMLDKGVFKEPFYQSLIPMFPLAVAWIIDFGFLDVTASLARFENTAFFFPLALTWHTVQVAVAYIAARGVLARLVGVAKAFRRGRLPLFVVYNALAFALITFALLGAAELLGVQEQLTSAQPRLARLAGVNFLWYVTAFLLGRELIRLLMTDPYVVPSATNGAPAAEE